MKNFALALFLVGVEAYFGCASPSNTSCAVENCSALAANTCTPDIFFGSPYHLYINCSANPMWTVQAYGDVNCTFPVFNATGATATQCVDVNAFALRINCDSAAMPPTNGTSPTAAPPAPSSAAVLGLTAASFGLMFL